MEFQKNIDFLQPVTGIVIFMVGDPGWNCDKFGQLQNAFGG